VFGFLDSHFRVSCSRADAFAGYTVNRNGDRDGENIADLSNILNGVHPVRRVFIQNVSDRVPFDIINVMRVAVAVAPAFALFDQFRIDIFTQFAQCRRKIQNIIRRIFFIRFHGDCKRHFLQVCLCHYFISSCVRKMTRFSNFWRFGLSISQNIFLNFVCLLFAIFGLFDFGIQILDFGFVFKSPFRLLHSVFER